MTAPSPVDRFRRSLHVGRFRSTTGAYVPGAAACNLTYSEPRLTVVVVGRRPPRDRHRTHSSGRWWRLVTSGGSMGGGANWAIAPRRLAKRATSHNFGASNHTKMNSGRGFAPDPAGGAYIAPI